LVVNIIVSMMHGQTNMKFYLIAYMLKFLLHCEGKEIPAVFPEN